MQQMAINPPKLVIKLKARKAKDIKAPPKNTIILQPTMVASLTPNDKDDIDNTPMIGKIIQIIDYVTLASQLLRQAAIQGPIQYLNKINLFHPKDKRFPELCEQHILQPCIKFLEYEQNEFLVDCTLSDVHHGHHGDFRSDHQKLEPIEVSQLSQNKQQDFFLIQFQFNLFVQKKFATNLFLNSQLQIQFKYMQPFIYNDYNNTFNSICIKYCLNHLDSIIEYYIIILFFLQETFLCMLTPIKTYSNISLLVSVSH
ncbi:hypothetical protein pb186bvf_007742 [Paramecium bursaria]